jgi:hypothetical protein
MTPVEQFLDLLGQQGQLRAQGKKTIFHYDFSAGAMICFKTLRIADQIRLHNISVETPKHGVGTGLMKLVCGLADQYGVVIELTALPFGMLGGRIGVSKLITWYRSFGFVLNDDFYEDQVVDISQGLEMIRYPR